MSDFFQFYASGGSAMHLVTSIALAACFYTYRGVAILRWGPQNHGNELFSATMQLATRLLALGITVSIFGTMMGCVDVFAAVVHAPTEQLAYALIKGVGLAIRPMIWAMIVSIPVLFVGVVVRYRYAIKCML